MKKAIIRMEKCRGNRGRLWVQFDDQSFEIAMGSYEEVDLDHCLWFGKMLKMALEKVGAKSILRKSTFK